MRKETVQFCKSLEGGFVAWIDRGTYKQMVTQGDTYSDLRKHVKNAIDLMDEGTSHENISSLCFEESKPPELVIPRHWESPIKGISPHFVEVDFQIKVLSKGHSKIGPSVQNPSWAVTFFEQEGQPLKIEALSMVAATGWEFIKSNGDSDYHWASFYGSKS